MLLSIKNTNSVIPEALNTKVKNISVNVLFFASLQDTFKCNGLKLQIAEGSTLKELRDKLFSEAEVKEEKAKAIMYAVNHNYVSLDTKLEDKDEVAFLPFVSGG